MKKTLILALLFILMTPVFILAQDNERQAVILNEQGAAQIKSEKYGASIESFNRAISLNPNYPKAYYNLGTAYFHLKQFEKSADAFQKSIKLSPKYAEAYIQLGVVLAETEQYKKAADNFKEAISLKPGDSTAFYNLGCLYIRLKKYEMAIKVLEQAKQFGNNSEIHLNLGFAYAKQKNYPKAISEIREAVSFNPNDKDAQYLLGNIYILAKDKQSALAQHEKIKAFDANLAQKLYQSIYGDKVINVSSLK